MMAEKVGLPMGIEDFERIRKDDFYYVDKTGLIKELLLNQAYVNLFTRPRRFGKTLNMSMLKSFFEIGNDRTIFDGLEIANESELCNRYMGKFPVIGISLKSVEGQDFVEAKEMLRGIIGDEALRFEFLMKSARLTDIDRKRYQNLIKLNDKGEFGMSDKLLKDSLLLLSQLLQKHYEQKAIILIDEYDVPLDKAYHNGYYENMTNFIRALFNQALKTNNSLYFAVLTGCLRVSRESIFTGFNNFNVYTVKDMQYAKYFGFHDMEVRELLDYYGFMEHYHDIKNWYDGYRFGELDIYCPWDVISYCHALKMHPSAAPQNYWINTSSNDIIRKFLNKADAATRDEIEQLIEGGSIKKEIHQELTYRDLNSDIENLWSLLFTTGYLTQCGKNDDEQTELVIPNREIHWIFVHQIRRWFIEEARKDSQKIEALCKAFEDNNITDIEQHFNAYLKKTISIRDNSVKKEMKENFYHGILLGLFGSMHNWKVQSNAESGDGYSDISVQIEDKEIGIIIELKYAENAQLDAACIQALNQIKTKNYEEILIDNGAKTIYRYGIACYKKRCKVVSE